MNAESMKILEKIAATKIQGTKKQKNRFLVFAMHFWGNGSPSSLDTSYIDDWVKRFNRDDEYIYADYTRLDILSEKVDGITNAKTRMRQQYTKAGWNKASIEDRIKKLYPQYR
jgi:hypothetical protein